MLDEVGCRDLGAEGSNQVLLLAPRVCLFQPHHVTKQPHAPKATVLSYRLDRAKVNPSLLSCFLSCVL